MSKLNENQIEQEVKGRSSPGKKNGGKNTTQKMMPKSFEAGFFQGQLSILRNPGISNIVKLVYFDILSYAWQKGFSYPSQALVGKDLKLSRQTINKHVMTAKKLGLFDCMKRGLRASNFYIFKDMPPELQRMANVGKSLHPVVKEPLQETYAVEEDEKNEIMVSPVEDSRNFPSKKQILEEMFNIMKYYYGAYYDTIGKEHPRLKMKQQLGVAAVLHEVQHEFTFEESDWKNIIDRWFITNIETDYNINHFASKKIIEHRWIEFCRYG